MRSLLAIAAALTLGSCATSEDDRFHVGQSENAFVIIGVAEASGNTSARYEVLWRQVDGVGDFAPYDGRTSFQAQTNEGTSLRVRGIPGEFAMLEIAPGTYALDSVFGVIRADRVNYIANGVVTGPDRPTFEVRPGEAVYLGIWQVDIEDNSALTRLWRFSETDLRAVMDDQNRLLGDVRMRETVTRAVPCHPRRMNSISQRQVC